MKHLFRIYIESKETDILPESPVVIEWMEERIKMMFERELYQSREIKVSYVRTFQEGARMSLQITSPFTAVVGTPVAGDQNAHIDVTVTPDGIEIEYEVLTWEWIDNARKGFKKKVED